MRRLAQGIWASKIRVVLAVVLLVGNIAIADLSALVGWCWKCEQVYAGPFAGNILVCMIKPTGHWSCQTPIPWVCILAFPNCSS